MGWLVFISVTQLCLSVKRGVAGFGTLLTRLLKKRVMCLFLYSFTYFKMLLGASYGLELW